MLVTVTVRVKAALRAQSRRLPIRLPPHHHIHISPSAVVMGRQQTLGKCIGELGSSVSDMCLLGKFFGGGKTADPPVQTKLEEAFGGKRKRTGKTEAKVEVKACEGVDSQQGKGALPTLQMLQSLTVSPSDTIAVTREGW